MRQSLHPHRKGRISRSVNTKDKTPVEVTKPLARLHPLSSWRWIHNYRTLPFSISIPQYHPRDPGSFNIPLRRCGWETSPTKISSEPCPFLTAYAGEDSKLDRVAYKYYLPTIVVTPVLLFDPCSNHCDQCEVAYSREPFFLSSIHPAFHPASFTSIFLCFHLLFHCGVCLFTEFKFLSYFYTLPVYLPALSLFTDLFSIYSSV